MAIDFTFLPLYIRTRNREEWDLKKKTEVLTASVATQEDQPQRLGCKAGRLSSYFRVFMQSDRIKKFLCLPHPLS